MNGASLIALLGLGPELSAALGLSLKLAGITTALLVVLGLPLAHWLNQTRHPGALVLDTLIKLPIVLPPVVLGFYLLVLFSPQFFLGWWWQDLTGQPLAFTFPGLVVASVLYSLPFAVQPFQAGLRAVPSDLTDASRALGASPWRTFFRVQLPLAKDGILVGMALSFAHTLGEFGVVLMIGGAIPGETKVASIALYDEVQLLNYSGAHRFAAILLGISFGLLLVITLLQRRR